MAVSSQGLPAFELSWVLLRRGLVIGGFPTNGAPESCLIPLTLSKFFIVDFIKNIIFILLSCMLFTYKEAGSERLSGLPKSTQRITLELDSLLGSLTPLSFSWPLEGNWGVSTRAWGLPGADPACVPFTVLHRQL